MRFERFIARRLLDRTKGNFSRPLVNIATYTIALGVVVMTMSIFILRGFQREISNKVVGFGSHITLRSYGYVNDYDEMPIDYSPTDAGRLGNIEGVAHVQSFAYKGGMLKTDQQIHGIVFKGVDASFDSSFFSAHLVRGRLMHIGDSMPSDEVIVSQSMANKLNLDTGMKARTYFWAGDTYRARPFKVVGIYNTDLAEFDNHYIIGDIGVVRRINNWTNGEVGGYELLVDDIDDLQRTADAVKEATPHDIMVTTIVEQQPAMFAWLDLLNSNIALILVIMAVVCATSVVSALLIMIFEKTSMIGLLKTLGCDNRSIRRIFLTKAGSIIGKGVIIGLLLAALLAELQARLHIIHLDSESYSMSFVPVEINLWYLAAVGMGTLLVCLFALLLPSTYIAHIDPAKTLRVE